MEGLIFDKEHEGVIIEAYRALCANVLATLGEKKVVEFVAELVKGDTVRKL